MARYIKANSKVAEHLNLTGVRNRLADGNYLLWQADMLAFGRPSELPQILERIEGIALQAHEAREEQDGTATRELPEAADHLFALGEKTGEKVVQASHFNADYDAGASEEDSGTENGKED